MRFSDYYQIKKTGNEAWFDPTMHADTKLFIDPMLLFDSPVARWQAQYDVIVDFFNEVLMYLADAGLDTSKNKYMLATAMLRFKEPHELCMGVGEATTMGAGTGPGLQIEMTDAAAHAIREGITEVDHFEELVLFAEGIGADRIGDIAGNIIKAELIRYTQEICESTGVPMARVPVTNARWKSDPLRWQHEKTYLPVNPYTGLGLILAPAHLLRHIPVVDPNDFWDWSFSNANDDIRGQFNYRLAKDVDSKEIKRLARLNPALAKKYVSQRASEENEHYDFDGDPASLVRFSEDGAALAQLIIPAVQPPTEEEQFVDFVARLIEAFRHQVEDRDGWKLLWYGDQPRSERFVQALFSAVVVHYCLAYDVDMSGEADAGRGPVDFKFSIGWKARALVEVKLAKNTKYWNGVKSQLPIYMKAEGIKVGWFVTIQYLPNDMGGKRPEKIKGILADLKSKLSYDVKSQFVDARRKVSASNKQED